VTKRLAESVGRLCEVMPIKHAALFFGLSWGTVKAVDKARLTEKVGVTDLSDVRIIAMDEFAIQKGHRYATVVVEPLSKRVLWVGRGRSRETIRSFFRFLGEEGCKRIEAVAMDMNGAYEVETREWCPRAEIVYDLFHVVAKYAREVVVRVRRAEVKRMAGQGTSRRVIKGSRWLLLRSRRSIGPEDQIRLRELLDANQNLMKVYVLGEDLRQLWSYRRTGAAKRFWKSWYQRAMQSGIPLLIRFAERLKPYLPGIIAHCRYSLHTSLLEGMNNKIKVIKRMAYGFRDDDYFFLKIKAAFPGIQR
jgi:transposase